VPLPLPEPLWLRLLQRDPEVVLEPERLKKALCELLALGEGRGDKVPATLWEGEEEAAGEALLDCWMLALAAGD